MRTFVAVEVSDEKVIESISEFQTRVNIDARPVRPHNLHFTLQFLGEISTDMAQKIKLALSAVEFARFTVSFRGVGAFPNPRIPRVVWVGIDQKGKRGLQEVASRVESALAPLGFSSKKPFKPHVTILRMRKNAGSLADKLEGFESAEFGRQKVTGMKFKQSVLTPHGPEYSDLEEVTAV